MSTATRTKGRHGAQGADCAEQLRAITGQISAAYAEHEAAKRAIGRLADENRQLRALAAARGIDVGAALSLRFRWAR